MGSDRGAPAVRMPGRRGAAALGVLGLLGGAAVLWGGQRLWAGEGSGSGSGAAVKRFAELVRECGSPAVDAYVSVDPACLGRSGTARAYRWVRGREGAAGPSEWALWQEERADYDGLAVRWGVGFKKTSARGCALACLEHEPGSVPGPFQDLPCAFPTRFCCPVTPFPPPAPPQIAHATSAAQLLRAASHKFNSERIHTRERIGIMLPWGFPLTLSPVPPDALPCPTAYRHDLELVWGGRVLRTGRA